MKYKTFLFFLFTILIYGCSSHKVTINNEMLIKSINSDEFEKCFRVCERNNDSITVYINLNEFVDCPSFNLECKKVITFEKSNFKINPEANNRKPRIILYDFKKVKNNYKFRFIDFPSNHNLILTLNKNSKVINFECGVF